MRLSPEGDGGEAGPRQPGRGRVSRPGSRRCPRGLGAPGGPIQGGLTVLAGGVPVQAWRKHLRVPTGVGTAGGDRVGPQLRSTLAAWGGGSGPDGRSPPQPLKGRRGRGGAARTHPAGDLGSRECALRPCTSGRETPRDEPRKGGETPASRPPPLPPPVRPRPQPGPAHAGPAPPPASGGPARPGPAQASPSPLQLRFASELPRLGLASPGRRRRRLRTPLLRAAVAAATAAAALGACATASAAAAAAASTARGTLSL